MTAGQNFKHRLDPVQLVMLSRIQPHACRASKP
nr:MAG TPA: hypothetical protein [Caudoviricetes sp.]